MLNFLESTAAGGDLMGTIILMVIMVAVFYFMLIRPENKRKKESEEMRSSIKVGDEITSIGGIVGKVVDVKEDKIVFETGADRVRIEMAKWGVSSNETATARAQEEAKKAQEAKAKARAAKKAEKNQ